MSKNQERCIKVPVIDDATHYIIGYEDVTEDEIRMILAYKLATKEIQRKISELLCAQ